MYLRCLLLIIYDTIIKRGDNMHLQESGEMYLETIYVLANRNKDVRSIDIARELNYSKPSVSRSMIILKKD